MIRIHPLQYTHIVPDSAARHVQLRPSREADIDFVLRLERDPENSPFVASWSREQHLGVITGGQPGRAHWIIEAPGVAPAPGSGERQPARAVGYLISYDLRASGHGMHIKRMVVAEKNQGIGRQALEQFVRSGAGGGRGGGDGEGGFIWLDVMAENHRAQAAYRAAGFRILSLSPAERANWAQLVGSCEMGDVTMCRGERSMPITIAAFESCAIARDQWNHRAHLTVAYLLLRQGTLEEATQRMCEGVQRYNAAHGIAQTPTGGYHHTLTIAWMRVLHATMLAYGHADTAEQFLDQHPHLLSKTLLRLFYSRPRIMSREAQCGWVEPDLAPLPRVAEVGGRAE
jgi:ribosomal protein S18 acetylase RimI-like enzyme